MELSNLITAQLHFVKKAKNLDMLSLWQICGKGGDNRYLRCGHHKRGRCAVGIREGHARSRGRPADKMVTCIRNGSDADGLASLEAEYCFTGGGVLENKAIFAGERFCGRADCAPNDRRTCKGIVVPPVISIINSRYAGGNINVG